MARLTVLNPIQIHPLTLPSSTRSRLSITTLDSSAIWDCRLLQPPFAPTSSPSPSTSSPPSSQKSPTEQAICDAQQRLTEILCLHDTNESRADTKTQNLKQLSPIDSHYNYSPHVNPVSYRPSPPPPPYAMHPPLTSTTRSRFPSHRLRTRTRPSPKSTMSYKLAAPIPRIPLASVLQCWSAHEVRDEDGNRGCKYEQDVAPYGLGLVLEAGPTEQRSQQPSAQPYSDLHVRGQSHPLSHSHVPSQSQSRSRYSRRLRRLAPAPLQLAPPTSHHVSCTLTSPVASAPPTKQRPRIPASAEFVEIPLNGSIGLPSIPDLSSSAAVSPQLSRSARRPSLSSSAMVTLSRAPTSLAFPPTDSAHVSMNSGAEMSDEAWYGDLLSWRRGVCREVDSPLSPVRAPTSAKCVTHSASGGTVHNATVTPLKSSVGDVQFFPQITPGLLRGTAPPALPRIPCNPLPAMTDEAQLSHLAIWEERREEGTGYARHADLRVDLDTEDLMLRAEMCSESIARASLSLRSCSRLKDPEEIAEVCDDLRRTFSAIQHVLEDTPTDFLTDGSDARSHWYTKHCHIISSLDKNLSLFYLLAHQVEDRPPRIHKLDAIINKLHTYQGKFSDITRRLSVSHEKLQLLCLHTQLTTAHTLARVQVFEERRRRRDERAVRQEGRMRRHAIREEIRRVRGTIRATMRSGAARQDYDENVFMPDEDENMADDKADRGAKRWRVHG